MIVFGAAESSTILCLNACTSRIDGFLYDSGRYTTVDVPGASDGFFGTQINGINDENVVVGVYGAGPTLAGMVWTNGRFATLNYPKAGFTELHSINNRGEITGAYSPTPGGQEIHGFLAIPKDR